MGPNCSRLCGYSPPAIVACLSHEPAANPTLTSLKRGEVASADAARHIVVLMFSLNEYTQISVKNIKIIALTNYFPPPEKSSYAFSIFFSLHLSGQNLWLRRLRLAKSKSSLVAV